MDKPNIEETSRPSPARQGVLAQALGRLEVWMRRLRGPGEQQPEPLPDAALSRPYPWEANYPRGIDWDQDFAPLPVYALLDQAVTRFGDRPCLDFLGRRSSYKDIGQLVDKAAKGFQELGVGKGVRVGLFLPNCPYYVISFFAILKAGGTVVNFNPLYAEREIARQIDDSKTKIMVTLNIRGMYPKAAARLKDTCLEKIVVGSMGGLLPWRERTLFALLRRKEIADVAHDDQHITFKKLTANDGKFEPVEIDAESDVAVQQYTGGTTGLPKGAELSHAALSANTEQVRMWATEAKPGEERVVGVLPLFHVFGMTAVMNSSLANGFEIILLPRFRLDQLLKLIDQKKPTVMLGVPTMYSAINGSKLLDDYDLSSLKFCISGGAPLPSQVQATFETLTGCSLVEGYGLTEAGPVCTINPFHRPKPGSVGLPLPGTLIEITDLDDPDRRLPIGQRGEICITGPQVMNAYAERDAETAEALHGGRLHTGDVGFIDNEGYVYLIDRIKDLILSGGFNVYPRMVEEAIELHNAVEEVTVCGIPDQHRGEIVKAYVKLKEGKSLTSARLRAFLKDKLAPFEQPRQIEFRDELPRTLIGKPSRHALIVEEMRRLNEADGVEPPSLTEPLITDQVMPSSGNDMSSGKSNEP